MVRNEPAAIEFALQDVFHTLRPGHRLMVQVQSTWFPLIDRNPQTFVPNIYKAKASDFRAATMRIHQHVAVGKQQQRRDLPYERGKPLESR